MIHNPYKPHHEQNLLWLGLRWLHLRIQVLWWGGLFKRCGEPEDGDGHWQLSTDSDSNAPDLWQVQCADRFGQLARSRTDLFGSEGGEDLERCNARKPQTLHLPGSCVSAGPRANIKKRWTLGDHWCPRTHLESNFAVYWKPGHAGRGFDRPEDPYPEQGQSRWRKGPTLLCESGGLCGWRRLQSTDSHWSCSWSQGKIQYCMPQRPHGQVGQARATLGHPFGTTSSVGKRAALWALVSAMAARVRETWRRGRWSWKLLGKHCEHSRNMSKWKETAEHCLLSHLHNSWLYSRVFPCANHHPYLHLHFWAMHGQSSLPCRVNSKRIDTYIYIYIYNIYIHTYIHTHTQIYKVARQIGFMQQTLGASSQQKIVANRRNHIFCSSFSIPRYYQWTEFEPRPPKNPMAFLDLDRFCKNGLITYT